ncbi:MAG: 16S rRNA pseudouridine(516) synthase [Clostridia bacterium]|nr:16S rRNA pseudouridine(516) synthase [Clostridia bacterium]
MEKIRLDKFISNQKGISRSVVRKLILKGQATVNSVTVRDFSYILDADADEVCLNGEKIGYNKYVYILMNKPKGVICSTDDKRSKTVIDLLPEIYKNRNLFPVGRLDKDTTGLLVITDDGGFAHSFISPKKHIEKSYIVMLDGKIDEQIKEKFANGVVLKDGTTLKSAMLEILEESKARVIITEGKYHQIKRMFGTVGLGVNELHRERIGSLSLPHDLNTGEFCEISSKTAQKLQENPRCVQF